MIGGIVGVSVGLLALAGVGVLLYVSSDRNLSAGPVLGADFESVVKEARALGLAPTRPEALARRTGPDASARYAAAVREVHAAGEQVLGWGPGANRSWPQDLTRGQVQQLRVRLGDIDFSPRGGYVCLAGGETGPEGTYRSVDRHVGDLTLVATGFARMARTARILEDAETWRWAIARLGDLAEVGLSDQTWPGISLAVQVKSEQLSLIQSHLDKSLAEPDWIRREIDRGRPTERDVVRRTLEEIFRSSLVIRPSYQERGTGIAVWSRTLGQAKTLPASYDLPLRASLRGRLGSELAFALPLWRGYLASGDLAPMIQALAARPNPGLFGPTDPLESLLGRGREMPMSLFSQIGTLRGFDSLERQRDGIWLWLAIRDAVRRGEDPMNLPTKYPALRARLDQGPDGVRVVTDIQYVGGLQASEMARSGFPLIALE